MPEEVIIQAIAEVAAIFKTCHGFLKTTELDITTRDVLKMTELVLHRANMTMLVEEEEDE